MKSINFNSRNSRALKSWIHCRFWNQSCTIVSRDSRIISTSQSREKCRKMVRRLTRALALLNSKKSRKKNLKPKQRQHSSTSQFWLKIKARIVTSRAKAAICPGNPRQTCPATSNQMRTLLKTSSPSLNKCNSSAWIKIRRPRQSKSNLSAESFRRVKTQTSSARLFTRIPLRKPSSLLSQRNRWMTCSASWWNLLLKLSKRLR